MRKSKVISALLVVWASCMLAAGAIGIKSQKTFAYNANSTLSEPTTFAAIEGASIRYNSESAGIRFSTLINDEWLDKTLAGKTVEYGYIVAENFEGTELTEANGGKKVKAEVLLEVDADNDGNKDFYRYNFAITDIPETEYETKVSACPYVTIDGDTQYGTVQTRSIVDVAARAFAAGADDPDNIIKGYVNSVAESVSFSAETQKINKANITEETFGLVATTQPAGYAVKLTSSDESVAKIIDGKIVPQTKEGTATITANFGTEKSATYELTVVSYTATLGGVAISADSAVNVNVNDAYFASVNAPTSESTTAAEKFAIRENDGTNVTDITANVEYTYSKANVAEVDDSGNITGKTVSGTTNVTVKDGDVEAAKFAINGWTVITTKKQMDELGLATWRLRDNKTAAEAVLAGYYVLGNDIDYNKSYIIPIANAVNKYYNKTNHYNAVQSDCVDTFLWRDVLSDPSVTPAAEWTAIKFGTEESTFRTTNPHDLPFTGTFDGNGYEIKNGKMFFANGFIKEINGAWNGTDNYWTVSSGCVFGENAGTIKNVAFTDLQYSDTYYGNQVTSEETFAGHSRGANWSVKGPFPVKDNARNNAFCGFIYSNKGTISNVRVDAIAINLDATYGTERGLTCTRGALGVRYNWEDGVIENLIVNEKNTTFTVKGNDGTTVNAKAGISVAEFGLFGYNAGTIRNSAMVANSAWQGTAGVDGDQYTCYFTLIIHNGEKYDACNEGTITNSQALIGGHSSLLTSADYTALLDTFSSDIWNKATMTLKKGIN